MTTDLVNFSRHQSCQELTSLHVGVFFFFLMTFSLKPFKKYCLLYLKCFHCSLKGRLLGVLSFSHSLFFQWKGIVFLFCFVFKLG